MMRYGVSGSRMRESSRSAAMYPIFELGISIVVRWGSMIRDSAELSKPVMNISSGTRTPLPAQCTDQINGDEIVGTDKYFRQF